MTEQKYRTMTVYYPHHEKQLSNWVVGEYINELLGKGIVDIRIVNRERHEPDDTIYHRIEEEYTDVQGNVGSS